MQARREDGGAINLHRRILTDLERQILSGAWPPGHRIPLETELARQYQCSRMTVNKVLTQLAKAGLIERRKRSGSFVRHPQTQAAILEIHDVEAEVASLKLPYQFELLSRSVRGATASDQRRIAVGAGVSVLDVTCLHFAGARPFCLEQRLISLAAVPDAAETDFTRIAPSRWLLNRLPWSRAEHRIEAVAAGSLVARRLGIEPHAACLVVQRRTWTSGQPVTHVRFTYPGTRHSVLAYFTPQS